MVRRGVTRCCTVLYPCSRCAILEGLCATHTSLHDTLGHFDEVSNHLHIALGPSSSCAIVSRDNLCCVYASMRFAIREVSEEDPKVRPGLPVVESEHRVQTDTAVVSKVAHAASLCTVKTVTTSSA